MAITITHYNGERTLFVDPDQPGWEFQASMSSDDDQTAPWDNEDGHGNVRTVNTRGLRGAGKKPGEVCLHSDGGNHWLYDFAAAVKTARKEGWRDLGAEEVLVSDRALASARVQFLQDNGRILPQREITEELLAPFAKPLAPGEIAVLAVNADMKRLRLFLQNDWCYAVVKVEVAKAPTKLLLDASSPTYVGGVESDADGSYLHEIWEDQAYELVVRATKEANKLLPNGMQVPATPLTQAEQLDLRKQAVDLYNTGLGEPTIEVEEDAAITLTEDGCPEPGAWVQVWVYVPFERAKVS